MDIRMEKFERTYSDGSAERFWLIFPHGNITQPILMLADYQIEQLFEQWEKEKKPKR